MTKVNAPSGATAKPFPMVSVPADLISRTSDTLCNVFDLLREELGVRVDSISSNGRLIQGDLSEAIALKGVADVATAMCAIDDLKYELDVLEQRPSEDLLAKCIREVEEEAVMAQVAGRVREGRSHVNLTVRMRDLTAEKAVLANLALDAQLLVAKADFLKAIVAYPPKPKKVARLQLVLDRLELQKAEQQAAAMAGEAPSPEAVAEAKIASRDGCRDGLEKVSVTFGKFHLELYADADTAHIIRINEEQLAPTFAVRS